MDDDPMFISIGREPVLPSISKAVICTRCGVVIIHHSRLDLTDIHDQWHTRNDHSASLPDNGDAWP